ncbi:MAG: dTDP-4-dehydrorhamnose 3,5-epimerase [Chitinophagaceae bacterium]|jgi:dTDP-4-dehydrorhamnose 3,5-epimerase
MKIDSTPFEGLFVLAPRVFADERGYFFESFNELTFRQNNIDFNWVQDNQSSSKYGVIRGLHFQKPPYAQTKLIRVLQGEILDVVVDLRHASKTFGQSYSIVLSSQNHFQLLIPKGFAHGFSVLSVTADVMYKCDELYNKESESGILFNDPKLGIDWKVDADKMVVSSKDLTLPAFDRNEIIF